MERHALHSCIVVALAWLLGVTTYVILKEPAPAGEHASGLNNAWWPIAVTSHIFADERAPKKFRLPTHWAHQRWGSI